MCDHNLNGMPSTHPSVPTMPSRITLGPKHRDAQRIAIAAIGAVVRLTDIRHLVRGKGICTGTITKKMDKMKTTIVAIEKPSSIAGRDKGKSRRGEPNTLLVCHCLSLYEK